MNKQSLVRAWHTFRLYTILSSGKRADYLRKHKIFHSMGENCTIVDRKVPLFPKLISIGNNVHLAAKVLLIPHDAVHLCLNNYKRSIGEEACFKEKVGCINIGNNVFIGSNVTILYDVNIGSKVIIGAGSLVNKDIPENSVVVGNPIKVISSFDDFVTKRENLLNRPESYNTYGHVLTSELETWYWQRFKESR